MCFNLKTQYNLLANKMQIHERWLKNSARCLIKNIETRLTVVARSSSTSHFKALKKLCFHKYKSRFKVLAEKLKFQKSLACFHKFAHALTNKGKQNDMNSLDVPNFPLMLWYFILKVSVYPKQTSYACSSLPPRI